MNDMPPFDVDESILIELRSALTAKAVKHYISKLVSGRIFRIPNNVIYVVVGSPEMFESAKAVVDEIYRDENFKERASLVGITEIRAIQDPAITGSHSWGVADKSGRRAFIDLD
jgi:hypothetical protein